MGSPFSYVDDEQPGEITARAAGNGIGVEVELVCDSCRRKKNLFVPVVCSAETERGKEKLVCEVAGDISLPKCKCGGTFRPKK